MATATMPPRSEFADLVAAVVESCPGVAALSGGRFGEAATYLPGRRVSGVRISDDVIEVHVVARWGMALPELADAIRAACDPLSAGRRVDVVIEDLELPPGIQIPAVPADQSRATP